MDNLPKTAEYETNIEFEIFLSSSMLNVYRESVKEIIDEINQDFRQCLLRLHAYGITPFLDYKKDTQRILNSEAATKHLLILLADNNIPIGEYTFEEYKAAHEQAKDNDIPYIKVFLLYDNDNDQKKIECKTKDGTIRNFENILYNDSKRYVNYIKRSCFKNFLKQWITNIAKCGFANFIIQTNLSYERHLQKIGQNGFRESGNRYYRRDRIDGKIETIFAYSPIVILEGNTYSGKTRAAFEFMKNRKEWEKYDFHIYDNRNTVKDLNRILKLDYTQNSQGNVFLFDDINDILKNSDNEDLDFRDRSLTLWSRLNGYNQLNGFSPEDLGKTRIIFTVSGKLSSAQKYALYCRIFNIKEDNENFRNSLKKIIVNFDIYDHQSFRQLVNAMVREGTLDRARIRPGNYTIGSLFIREEDIRLKVQNQYNQYSAGKDLMLSLAAHFKYAAKSGFSGSVEELLELYGFRRSNGRSIDRESYRSELYEGIERLRSAGLVVQETYGFHPRKIFIDRLIFDILYEVVIDFINPEKRQSIKMLNEFLLNYAKECQNVRGQESNLSNFHICFVAQMGYLLIDRNELEDWEIRDLIEKVAMKENIGKEYGIKKDKYIGYLKNIAALPGHYDKIFASAAIARIKNFEYADKLLNGLESEDESDTVDLYKRAVYAMLSTGNRTMTIEEESRVLNRIFDDDGNWKEPFDESDLKDVFNLARLTGKMKNISAVDIINLLPEAVLSDLVKDSDESNEDDCDSDEEESSASAVIHEKIFLKQLDKAAIVALRRIHSFDEFETALECLRTACCKSENVKDAVKRYFVRDFYKAIREIAGNMNYADRAEFFSFILEIDDERGVLGNIEIPKDNIAGCRTARILGLNKLLEYLDERAALEGYGKMIEKGLYDPYSLSCLMKNEYVNFEQVLRFAVENEATDKKDERINFITMNQLMGKAETLSDADMCMRLMGITDCNPCKLRDENALVAYIQIRGVDFRKCIEIIKGRRLLYPDVLSDNAISAILNKFNICQLVDVFFPSGQNPVPGYYQERYGFLDEEIMKMRKNAIHINKLFFKANAVSGGPEIIRLIEDKFNDIKKSDELRFLISDPEKNGNNGILSVYMKNKDIFKSYKDLVDFYDGLPENCKPVNVDNNIYSVFLWKIVDRYNNRHCDRTKAIEMLNEKLIEAYKEFAKRYPKDKVMEMMPKLYRYRPLLADESTFDKEEKYAYEDRELSMTFTGYLDYLIKYNPAFVDGTFIFNALTMMRNGIDNNVYEKLAVLASLNHTGVKYDTVFKSRGEGNSPVLSENVRRKLFRIGAGGVLDIDSRLVYNVSYIKVLWFLLSNRLITLENAEKYRRENNIPVTETYLNMVFKNIEQAARKDWIQSGNDNEILRKGFDLMVDKMEEVFSAGAAYVRRSVQMCISLIAVAPDEESLNIIFADYGFGELEGRTEVLAARMTRLVQLCDKSCNDGKASEMLAKFKEMIFAYCRNVNIWVINAYLRFCWMIASQALESGNAESGVTPLKRCWPLLEKEGKIDVFELLGPDETTKAEISAAMDLPENKWILDANVQTFSYFAEYSPNLISMMDSRFEGNFTYDDSGRKSCLKYALKNYALSYKKHKEADEECVRRELEYIIRQILTRENNKAIFRGVCKIIKYSAIDREKSVEGAFWEDLSKSREFRNALVRHNSIWKKKPES